MYFIWLLEKGLQINIGANYMSSEFIYFEITKSDVVCVGSLWIDLPESRQIKPGLVSRAN